MKPSNTISADDRLIQHLGAAILLCWQDLPAEVQERILIQSEDIIGVEPVVNIRDRLLKLIRSHAPKVFLSSSL